MNSKSSLASELKDKEYRRAFVRSQVKIGLPMQCRALREGREWTQPELAEAAGMSQPRISEIERPGERKLNLETLFRLAEAFDVALQVRFVSFRDFVDAADALHLDNLAIKPFEEDLKDLENEEIWAAGKAANLPMRQELKDNNEPDESALNPRPQNVFNIRKGAEGAISGGGPQQEMVVGLMAVGR